MHVCPSCVSGPVSDREAAVILCQKLVCVCLSILPTVLHAARMVALLGGTCSNYEIDPYVDLWNPSSVNHHVLGAAREFGMIFTPSSA